ncbi:hypothetical protein BSG1_11826 [Bacillus sp. SG-1]|nr:hypothetical protein BSG1_11826 [Bacillus sp. SG-1]
MTASNGVAIIGIIQSKYPLGVLPPLETLQINLTKSEEKLYLDMNKSTRQQIRQAEQKYDLVTKADPTPNENLLIAFRNFYNTFASNKHTYKCNAFHLKTLKLLAEQRSLLITSVEDSLGETLCYRVYVIDGKRATSLYSAAHFRQTADKSRKRLLSAAHRYLKWKDMLWLKHRGYIIYDSGGLTSDPAIRNFKLEFGGEIVKEYSGYIATNLFGRAVLSIRNWNLRRGLRVKT